MVPILPPSFPGNNPAQKCRWHTFNSSVSLESAAIEAILIASKNAIQLRHSFHLVLAGGSTPREIYKQLCSINTDWSAWHIYFGDERCLPVDHKDRNSQMAIQSWLSQVSIPAHQIHIIPAELGAEAAARSYAITLSKIAMFDLVLLGLGEDGHTASLFPNHAWGENANAPDTLTVFDAPKFPSHRVSLSAHRLSNTRQLIFLISGDEKKQAVNIWQQGETIPATAIKPISGVDIYLNQNLSDI